MNRKFLSLLGAICLSIGVGVAQPYLHTWNYQNVGADVEYEEPYNSFIQNIANQTGQQKYSNIPVTLDNKIACIQKFLDLLDQTINGYITMQESQDRMLNMVPELLILRPQGNDPQLSEKFLTEFIDKAYANIEQYKANNNIPAKPEANANMDEQDEYFTYLLQRFQNGGMEVLLKEATRQLRLVKTWSDQQVSNLYMRDTLLRSLQTISAGFGEDNQLFKMFLPFIKSLLESY